ncbi:hypothetical protein [Streptomyces gobiensis]|uniref:hypothetical protein n=1 Tax=Streptomyces gobiensis TaxID=2875706 RepID=UPI001E54F1F4|nr:hypothetical protein [Streptomyces gobiensis]UGY92720.1 hypothetical protein test1122_13985 [Streptomyces gobiensis]
MIADCRIAEDRAMTVQLHRDRTAVEGAELLLRHRGRATAQLRLACETVLADLAGRPVAQGERVQAVLPPAPGLLREGHWDLLLATPGQEPRPLSGAGVLDTRQLLSPQRANGPGPLLVRLPYRTGDGTLALRVWERERHAEAGELHVAANGTLTVNAALHGFAADAGADAGEATLELRRRGEASAGDGGAEVEGERTGAYAYRFTVTPAQWRGGEGGEVVWDLYVRVGETACRLGRILDDIHDKKRVLTLPSMTVPVAGSGTRRLQLRPYYTVENNLSVVTRGGSCPAGH